MRCLSCDQLLNDHEASIKDRETLLFLDMCNECLTSNAHAEYNYSIDSGTIDLEDVIKGVLDHE
jgi:hypothetical protein|tara:strand:- start:1277 stop:1468 length:192 start_codon:yes stop_codon:yes gene_type:complete